MQKARVEQLRKNAYSLYGAGTHRSLDKAAVEWYEEANTKLQRDLPSYAETEKFLRAHGAKRKSELPAGPFGGSLMHHGKHSAFTPAKG